MPINVANIMKSTQQYLARLLVIEQIDCRSNLLFTLLEIPGSVFAYQAVSGTDDQNGT
jgi:hypothetical protein